MAMEVGLFLSEGGGIISSVVDLSWIASNYKDLSTIKILRDFNSPDAIDTILREVKERGLSGVVLGGESPLFYRKTRNGDYLLRKLKAAGINPNLIGIANLKEQVALPHRSTPVEATKKAKVFVDVALQKVYLSKPVREIEVAPKKSVAIFGSTTSGLMTGANLLKRGYRVIFIDQEDLSEDEIPSDLRPTLGYLKDNPLATFHTSDLLEFYGYAGNFRIDLTDGTQIRTGSVVVAVEDNIESTAKLYPHLRIERDENGLFKALQSETSTVETSVEGIFLLPVRGEDPLKKKLLYADSATSRIDELLNNEEIHHELFVSEVDEEVCGGCGTCIKTCIFKASELDPVKRLSSTNIHRCVGCGNCVSACPTGARDQVSASTAFLISAIKHLATYTPPDGVKVLYILCDGCGYPSLDEAGRMGLKYSLGILPLRVRCGGRVDTQLILEAFAEGFQGVVVCKCANEHCINIVGSLDLDRRANLFRAVLKSRGIEPEKLRIFGLSKCDGHACINNAVEFMEYLKRETGVLR